MSKNKPIIFLAALVALLPTSFIALPSSWEDAIQILLGLSIIVLSVWSIVDKRLSLKAKAQKRQAHKRQIDEKSPSESAAAEAEVEQDFQENDNQE